MAILFNASRFSNPKEVERTKAASLLVQLRNRLGKPTIRKGGDFKAYHFPHNVFDQATIITRKD